jgi:ribosomal protein S18 acetylase RimI-like enzyme
MQPTIREARPADAEQLIAHIQGLIEEPDMNIPLAPGEFNVTVEQERQILADYAASDNSVFLIAEAASQIVGQLSCKGGARRANRHAATLGMSVHKDWRNKGIGSALMSQAIGWAKNSGIITRIELYVYARNTAAIRLYQKFGFETEGRRRRVLYQNDEYLEDLIMALLL